MDHKTGHLGSYHKDPLKDRQAGYTYDVKALEMGYPVYFNGVLGKSTVKFSLP